MIIATIDPGVAPTVPGGLYATAQNDAFYRLSLPVLLPGGGAPPGTWKAIIEVDPQGFKKYLSSLERDDAGARVLYQQAVAHGLRYNFNVHSFSNLRMAPNVSQTGNEPGATLSLRVVLTEYGVPIDHRASVTAGVAWPDGTTANLALAETSAGVFEASMIGTLAGIYSFDIRAAGLTLRGRSFTRQEVRTAALWRGGNHEPPHTSGDPGGRADVCRWLECLLETAIDADAAKRLEGMGIRVEALRRCLKEVCR
jgi:hypothetical protein